MKHTIITGTGRSGTSFVAKCFERLGYDLGGEWKPDVRAGLECPESVAANQEILSACVQYNFTPGRIGFPTCKDSALIAEQQRVRDALSAITHPIIKDPSCANTLDVWIHAGKVERVIFCLRDPLDAWISFQGTPFKDSPLHTYEMLLARIGYVTWACRYHGIRLEVVPWPDLADATDPGGQALVGELMSAGTISAFQASAVIRSVDADFQGEHS